MKKGFTLIELLVVIAILAVLATAVILVINPVELIRQARDSTRISDLAAINSAVSLYLSDVASPGLCGPSGAACGSVAERSAGSSCPGNRSTAVSCTPVSSTTVDGNGWISVDFRQISSGSPLARLPVDPSGYPTPSTVCGSTIYQCYYSFAASSTLYEIDAAMESTKFHNGGSGDVESKDGGNSSDLYEVGSKLDL